MQPFCRDCHAFSGENVARCDACGSPRLLVHPERDRLAIAHIDCDAFYAAVEKRDRPELRNEAVIIGGGRRGVVATACYNARIHGVHSAQPMWEALKRCPKAVVIRPNMAKYAAVGKRVRELMHTLTPAVEPLSIDEAFLDLTGTERLHGEPAAIVLSRFASHVHAEVGITVSVGLSDCKYLAKLASDMDKPRGFSIVGRAEALSVLAQLPVGKIWGVGEAFGRKLERDGITHVAQLQRMDHSALLKRYGSMGDRLYRLSRGIDVRRVNPVRERKSVSAETTFSRDIASLDELRPILRRLSEKVSTALKQKDVAGRTIVLKLKTHDFRLQTRNRKLEAPTQLADRLYRQGLDLLARETDGRRFRLLGIGVAELCDPTDADPPDLVDPLAERNAKAERALDAIRARFGPGAVASAETLRTNETVRDHPYG